MSVLPQDFRYFLTYNNIRNEIIFAPDGWDTDTIVSYKRDKVYFGVIRSLALPLQFVLDGADLLRAAFYSDGIEAGVRVEVEQKDKKTQLYNLVFIGDIDFSKFEDTQNYVSVNLAQSGITRSLKAYEGVKYEYDLTGDDVVNMILPGVVFNEKADYIFRNYTTAYDRSIAGLDLINNDGNSGFVLFQNSETQNLTDNEIQASPNYFAIGNRVGGIMTNISGRIKGAGIKSAPGSGNDFRIDLRDQNNNVIALLYQSPSVSPPAVVPFDFTFNINHNLQNGQKLFIYVRTDTYPAALKVGIGEGELTVSYSAQADPSNCKGISAYNLFKRILNRISPGTPIDSFNLRTSWPNLIYTSGDAIREIATAKIKISFKEFFQDFVGLQDSGFGIENGIARIETGDYFARNSLSANVGEVKECDITVAEEYIYNSFNVGYDDGNTDDVDGKQEYNSGQVWDSVITRVQNAADWKLESRADQFGIEKLRVDYVKKTDDTSSDNDVFIIDCYVDGVNYRPILGSSYSLVTGLTSPGTAYNLRLTPKQNLLRHAPYLRSILDKLDGSYINFASGEKNTDLTTIKDGIRVKESENIAVSSLNGKYFLPYIATITCKLPKDTMWMIDNVPFGYINFVYKNVPLKGFIIEASVDIAKNTEREFKLLLTADNDLSQLAR